MVFRGAFDSSCFGSCSPSAHDADEAMSASSWASPAVWKKRDWWSADLEGQMEKLEVEGGSSTTEGGSMDPQWKVGHWSVRIKTTKGGSEEVKGAENEKQLSEMDHEASAEVQSQRRKVIRVESQVDKMGR